MKVNKIHNGDCIKIMKEKIEDNSISLIFSDPPYNLSGKDMKTVGSKTGGDWKKVNEAWDTMTEEDYFQFTSDWITESHRVLNNNGSIYISATYHNLGEILLNLKGNGFKIINVITWYKSNAMPNLTRRGFTHACEYIVWAVKGKGWVFNYNTSKSLNPEKQKNGDERQMRDMWTIPLCQGKERLKGEDNKSLHPTQKPEELLNRIINISSNEGDIILDPFSGSGTTAYIAKKYNREYIGIEKDKGYYKASLNRLKK